MEKQLTTDEAKLEFESHLLIGLFKATIEQSTHLTGKYKQKMLADFNLWQRIGFKLLEQLETRNITQGEYLDKIGDIYHTMNSSRRDEFYKGLE
jgi:putative Mn2+ efflux pump MntP